MKLLMKRNFNILVIGFLLTLILCPGCNKDGCEFDPIRYELIENSNPENVDVSITDNKKKDTSGKIKLVYRGGEGKVAFLASVKGRKYNENSKEPLLDLSIINEDNSDEKISDKYKYENSWVKVESSKNIITVEFKGNSSEIKPKDMKIWLGGFLTATSYMEIESIR